MLRAEQRPDSCLLPAAGRICFQHREPEAEGLRGGGGVGGGGDSPLLLLTELKGHLSHYLTGYITS